MADPSTVYVGNLNFDTPASGLVTFMEAAGVFAVDVDLKTRQDGSSINGLGATNYSIAGTILAISIEHPGPPFVETSLRFCLPSIRVVPGS